jgi:mannose-6-phosphate isomerase
MGVKRGVSKHDFHTLLRENRIEEGLNYLPVQKGDVLYIKTGTVHALVEGIMVCEIQENSDTTYRLYDWGRTGPDGKPRPLHIQKALDVIHFPTAEEYDTYMKDIFIKFDRKKMNTVHPLVRCRYFNFDYVHYSRDFDLSIEDDHFHALNIINGEGTLISSGGELGLRKGESVLVPRPVQNYSVQTRSIELLKTFL